MKTLPEKMVKAFDGLPKHRLTQVLRDGNRVIYRRDRLDGTLVGFEASFVKSNSFPIADGGRSEESEAYPRASRFGKDAWFCMSLESARKRLGL